MIKILLSFLFACITISATAQVDTIYLQKQEVQIYRCTNQIARFWYLKKIDNVYLLVNLTIPQNEIPEWFDRYSNSQNLFRSEIVSRNNADFFIFRRHNMADDRLTFEILRMNENEIVTQSLDTGEEFCFALIKF